MFTEDVRPLIGRDPDEVVDYLRETYPDMAVGKYKVGSFVTMDYSSTRLRVWYDKELNVVTNVQNG